MGFIEVRKKTAITLKEYPARYSGKLDDKAIYSCNLIAARLNDGFNAETGRFSRQRTLKYNYLDVVKKEVEAGKVLVAFGPSFVLQGVVGYIENGGYQDVMSTVVMRETMEWNTTTLPLPSPEVVPSVSDISVYSFGDKLAVFLNVSTDEADKILLYTNRNIELYSFNSYAAVRTLTYYTASDLEYLFPVTVKQVADYYLISSREMSEKDLRELVEFNRMSFTYSNVDELLGTFITWLLSESLYFDYKLDWADRQLRVYNCGYIQASVINAKFVEIMAQSTGFNFILLDGYEQAVQVAKETNCKCFMVGQRYYAAVKENIVVKDVTTEDIAKTGIDRFDWLSSLGFSVETNPIPVMKQKDLPSRFDNIIRSYPGFTPTMPYKIDENRMES